MPHQAVVEYGKAKGFHQQTLDRWLLLAESDQESLLDLVRSLKIGENHLRDFMDWLEEISLRDGVSFSRILEGESILSIRSDGRLGRNDKLKQIKKEMEHLRFPRLFGIEREIHSKIRKMKLQPRIQLSVPPSLEGGSLTVQLKAVGHGELKCLVREMEGLLDRAEIKEIFELLSGREENGGPEAPGSNR
jgi:hypothetical protein